MADLMNDRWNQGPKKKRTRKTTAKKTTAKKTAPAKKPTKKEQAAAAAKAEAEKKLPAVAKEINVRLEKADKAQGQADDHRLAAALKAAEAKKLSSDAGVKFADWSKDNIKDFSFETVRKLAAVGESSNPAEALKEMREKNKAANKRLRDKSKNLPKPQRGASKEEAVVDVALGALNKMPDTQRVKLLESVAHNEGLAVVPAASASKATSTSGEDRVQAAKTAFNTLDMKEKKAFVDWAQGRIDELSKEDGDMPEVPASLRRTRKTKPAKDAAPKKRTRRTAKAA